MNRIDQHERRARWLAPARALLAALALCAAAATPAAPSKLSLVVFDTGNPVAGVEVRIDGERVGTTNAAGALAITIAAGRHRLVLRRDGMVVGRVELRTGAGASVQILADLDAGNAARFRIAGASRARASGGESQPDAAGPPGIIVGRVVAAGSGEPVANARLYFSGLTTTVRTNAQGHYRAKIPAGIYQVSVIHPDFATQTLDQVHIRPGRTATIEITLHRAGLRLADYVVTAPYIEGSVAAIFQQRRESGRIADIIGAAQMARTGASNAAEALSHVTGLTIQNGKYVVIRGQPSRYTFTLWNGSPLPSPDPIRRTVPLDLFPTDVLASIAVRKTYTPDLPGAFGGGLIALNTLGLPESDFASVSVSTGFNSVSTGEEGLTYAGGETDWLGIDDGTRAIPAPVVDATNGGERSLTSLSDQRRAELGRTFPNIYQVESTTLPPDIGLSVAAGERWKLWGGDVGVLASFSYDRQWRKRESLRRTYSKNREELIIQNDFERIRTDMDVNLSGLLVLGDKWDNLELTSNTFITRRTTDRTQITFGFDATSDKGLVRDYLLSWVERELIAQQFIGRHDFELLDLEWRLMHAEATRQSLDRRSYRYEVEPSGDIRFDADTTLTRRYNTVKDTVNSFGLDLTIPMVESDSFTFKVQTGIAYYHQERTSETQRFEFDPQRDANLDPDNPEVIFAPENIGDTVTFRDQTLANDDYAGSASVDAIYLMADISWADILRVIAGVRREHADFSVRTFQQAAARQEAVTGGFENTRLLPALNVTWSITDHMQLRAALSKTVSRPTLNELSPATYFDTSSGELYVGNPELVPAKITSRDLRFSWYPSADEKFFVGIFSKEIIDPFERVFITRGGNDILNQVVNAQSATITGVEFGARITLERLGEWLGVGADFWSNLYLAGNGALIDSQVRLSGAGTATATTRRLQGQAERIFNLQAGYNGVVHDVTIAYNFIGTRLFRPGLQGKPNIMRQPVSSLDFTWAWRPIDSLQLKLELSNLLNPTVKLTQGGRIFRRYHKGVTASLSLQWSFY